VVSNLVGRGIESSAFSLGVRFSIHFHYGFGMVDIDIYRRGRIAG